MYPRFGELTFITPYGLLLTLALLACWFYARRRAAKFHIDGSHIDLIVPLVFAASLLGTLIVGTLSGASFAGVSSTPATARFSVFGLLAFALPALYAYCRLSGLALRATLDLFALPAIACLMLIRLGCFMAGCCWGDLVDAPAHLADGAGPELAAQVFTLPWFPAGGAFGGVSFPVESFAWRQHLELGLIEAQAPSSLPVHPTQLYEFVLLAILLTVLKRREDRRALPGSTVLGALGGYAVLRFFVEFLRADSGLLLGWLTLNQLLSAALLAACLMAARVASKNT